MATIEKRYLPSLSPGMTITEADRQRVLAGVNPTQPAPPNDDLRDSYRNDPAWLLQIRR